jgi:hypothetical protein
VSAGFDQYTPPAEPVASAVNRPRALFDDAGAVLGLRAASTRYAGGVRTVSVWLYSDPTAELETPAVWSLLPAGSEPAVTIESVTAVAAGLDPDGTPVPAHVDLTLAAAPLPGRAAYRLGLDPTAVTVDPLRVYLPVRLRPECGDTTDCVQAPAPQPPLLAPDYDTHARDYPALRATLLDRLLAANPQADTSPADVTVTLIELFAHLGDLLHYRLDRVATEAWLPTARRRADVTRHARVVDFAVPPAISAAATVQVLVERSGPPTTDPTGTVQPGDTATSAGDVVPDGPNLTLELPGPVTVRASHAEVALYDWTEDDARLDVGATSAVLVRPTVTDALAIADWLPVGTTLGFEVVAVDSPTDQQNWARRVDPWPPTGDAAIRPALRSRPAQVVRLTEVVEFVDPLLPGVALVRVAWDQADALTTAVPCSIDATAGQPVVGVARLGLFTAHHGLVVDGGDNDTLLPVDRLTGSRPDPEQVQVADYELVAAGADVSPGLSCAPGGRPWQLDVTVTLPGGIQLPAPRVTSLLRAPAAGLAVVVDFDDDDPPLLRFATGALGTPPPAGSTVSVRYQVGSGPAGNVARDALTRLVRCTAAVGVPCLWSDVAAGVSARNLKSASGGVAATRLDDVRRDAPQAYVAVPRRAVLVSDLPQFATEVPGVIRSTSRRSWSGSWPVAVVAVESAGDDSAGPALLAAVGNTLDAVRMAGTEAVALSATPVGLLFALTVCLVPGTDTDQARTDVLALLRPGTPAAPGLFAPGAHTIGTSIYVSSVTAVVAALSFVDAVRVTEARRLSDPAGTLEPVLVMGSAELGVCDDDPAAPDRGRIDLVLEGGR